jgi:cell division protein FtsZ
VRSPTRCWKTAPSRARAATEAAEATALITKAADPDANVIYGIVTDEAMGEAVKITVIATGFGRLGKKGAATPVDLTNHLGSAGAAADASGLYRRTPAPKVAMVGGRADIDVPTFLRKQGAAVGE